jgi:hypothetical protein
MNAIALARVLAGAAALLCCSRGAPMGDSARATPDAAGAAGATGAARSIPPAAVGARIDVAASGADGGYGADPSTGPSPATTSPALPLYGAVPFGGTPKIEEGGLTLSNAGLPRDVVQRVVRKTFARVRLCYEAALRGSPTLAGTLRVRFVIEGDGAIGAVTDAGSTVADASVVECALSGFDGLRFPAPTPAAGGVVGIVTIYLAPPPP